MKVEWLNSDEWQALIKAMSSHQNPFEPLLLKLSVDKGQYLGWVDIKGLKDPVLLTFNHTPPTIKLFRDDSYKRCLVHIHGESLNQIDYKGRRSKALTPFVNELLTTLTSITNQGEPPKPPIGTPEPTASDKVVIEATPEDQISVIHYDNFEEIYAKFDKSRDIEFKQNIKSFQNALTADGDSFYSGWVDLNQSPVLIEAIETDEYEYHAIPNNQPIPERLEDETKWHVIKFFEVNKTEPELCMQLRISLDGNFAELVYVKSTQNHSGSTILKSALALADKLGVQNTVILDDATISIQNKKNKPEKLPLRVIKPIADFSAQNWYAQHGFSFYPCKDLPVSQDKVTVTQNPSLHAEAIQTIRKTPVSFLKKLYHRTKQKLLDSMLKRQKLSKKATVGELSKKVLEASRQPGAAKTARNDLLNLYHLSLNSNKINRLECYKQDVEQRNQYRQAVECLNTYQVMIRKRPKT